MQKVRVGVIGVSGHPTVHLRALASMGDVEISALCDIDEEKLKVAAREYGVSDTFLDHRLMLENAELDVVWVVCSYPFTYPVALDCLKAGADTFLEKPPGLTTQECRDLAEAAQANGCKSMIGFNRRFNCVIVEAKRLLESVSPIKVVLADYSKGHGRFSDAEGRPVPPLRMDSIHHVDVLRFFGGEVEEIEALASSQYGEAPDSFHALIRFENGLIGQLNANHHALKVERLSLFAKDGWAGLEGMQSQINSGRVYAKGCWHELRGEAVGRTDFSGFWDEDRFFIDCLKNDRPATYPGPDLADGIKTMELVDGILEARP